MAGDDKPSRPEATEVVGPPRLLAGKYKIGKLIGEGGMGSVYAAEHMGLGATVAVKLLNESCIADPDSLARFRREARAMGAVRHDHVVTVMDTGTDDDGAPFIVMEYLEGETLASSLRRNRVLTPASATRIAIQVLAGLSAAHAKNIIHRDLKPGNVFMARQPDGSTRAKILDFGVSKLADAAALSVTADGVAVGTPTYMAPEQLRGDADLDARVDIYAVGVMLYRMLTGKLPFMGRTSEALNRKIISGTPTPLVEHRPEIKPALEAIVLGAMSVDRDDRYESADELRLALTGVSTSFLGGGAMASALLEAGRASPSSDASIEPHEPATVAAGPIAKRQTMPPVEAADGPSSATEAPTREAATQVAADAAEVAAKTSIDAPASSRRWVIGVIAALLAGAAATTVVLTRLGGGGPAGPPLRIGVSRFLPDAQLEARFAPLVSHLADELDRPVELVIAADTDDLIGKLRGKQVEIAALSPLSYVKARAALPSLALLATPVTRAGRRGYSGSILVRSDSAVRRLTELKGQPFCFVKPGSTSGFLMPRRELRRAGLDPTRDFPSVHYGQNHLGTLKLLHKKTCVGAAVFTKLWHDADDHGMDPSAFRSLADFSMPHDAYVAIGSLPVARISSVRDALLALAPSSTRAREVLEAADHGGFVAVEDSDYDAIRRALEEGDTMPAVVPADDTAGSTERTDSETP